MGGGAGRAGTAFRAMRGGPVPDPDRPRIGSAALVADGLHARTDGFTSLAVLLGAGGAAAGWPAADPVVGLLITAAILLVLRGRGAGGVPAAAGRGGSRLVGQRRGALAAVDGVRGWGRCGCGGSAMRCAPRPTSWSTRADRGAGARAGGGGRACPDPRGAPAYRGDRCTPITSPRRAGTTRTRRWPTTLRTDSPGRGERAQQVSVIEQGTSGEPGGGEGGQGGRRMYSAREIIAWLRTSTGHRPACSRRRRTRR